MCTDKVKKIIKNYIVITLLFCAFFQCSMTSITLADQTKESFSDKINSYPGYKELIENLKAIHPNWKFTIFYTGLQWDQVIKNETTAYHGRNVVPASKTSAWKCSTCGNTPRGGSSWRCASEAAVSYYMDPRNWINDAYIFQFENLAYNADIQTVDGVKKIISSIKYMQGDTINYTKTDGAIENLGKSYAQVIYDAASEAGISPYHLASRIRQEQGTGEKPGSTATGTYSNYTGYYNFLNIGASGSKDGDVTVNGLEYAKKNNWTTPEISIKEGAKILAKNYINIGQNTVYLQKFDVDNSDGKLYYHQYMQNVSVCLSEGSSVKKAYQDLNAIDSSFEFIIPVYENMPELPCKEPTDENIVTQNVKIKGSKVRVRSEENSSSSILAELNTGDTLLRIEIATSKKNGYYWDKVVLPNGTKGYVVHEYLVETVDVTNCNDMVIINGDSIRLRNGPGLTGTTVVSTLVRGQLVTRIETGAYNIDGYIWDRIKLADGRQGYVAQNYLQLYTNNSNNNENKSELVKVICKSGLSLREQPGTKQKILATLRNGEILTRTEANSSNVDGYIWDKVVNSNGLEGYIARGDSKEQYIEVISSNVEEKNDNFKVENEDFVCEPGTTIDSIKEKYENSNITVKKADGTEETDGNLGTGYVVTIEDKSYTVVKMGDVNGDAQIDIIDMALIKRDIVNTSKLEGIYKEAGKLNKGSGDIDIIDMALIKRHIVKKQLIEI